MRHFATMTKNQIVVMGRKTAESLAKPLKGRANVVISSTGYHREGMITVSDIDSLWGFLDMIGASEVWIIGGAGLYAHMMPWVDVLHLTEIDLAVPDADTFFPMDLIADWDGHQVTTVVDPGVKFWVLTPNSIASGRHRQGPCVAMDLNIPYAMWHPASMEFDTDG
ncbi:dihydrofolate reductase [Xanthomonas phage JGB6]|nr:dihydrofolate reductase [Xanthomonas phage JGB6]